MPRTNALSQQALPALLSTPSPRTAQAARAIAPAAHAASSATTNAPRNPTLASCALSALLLAMGLSGPVAVEAQMTTPGAHLQDGIHTAVGYAGVLPDVLLGGGLLHRLGNRPFGFFADYKQSSTNLAAERDYCPAGARPPVVSACTIDAVQARWNDIPLRDVNEYKIVNVGAFYAVSPELALMVGGGLVRPTIIREFSENIDREADEEPRVSEFGRYYVPFEEDPAWTTQVVVGALFRAGPRLVFRIGYESAPGGMSVGGYLVVR
jgi:hypothetical protein